MLLSEALTLMGNVETAEFALRCVSGIDCLFNDVEVGGIRFSCVNGLLVGRFEVVNEDPEVTAKLLLSALSLVSGCGFETYCVSVNSCMVNIPIGTSVTISPGQAPEQMNIPTTHIPITIRVSVGKTIDLDKGMLNKAVELMGGLRNALRSPNPNKRRVVDSLLRVVKWWVSGSLDEDPLDRFLKFFIAFEMLASLIKHKEKSKKGKNEDHKEKSSDSWAEEFCNDYGLICEFEGMRVNRIRNLIMHEPGKERDQAEEIARKHADEFGQEVFKAIRRALSEELGISMDQINNRQP